MPFWEHLEVLRWHLIRSLAAVLAVAVVAFAAKDFLFHTLLLGPTRPDFWTYRMLNALAQLMNAPALQITELPFALQSRQLAGQLTMHLQAAGVVGLIGGFPYLLWELWRFVGPAIPAGQRRAFRGLLGAAGALFGIGVLLGYYLMAPLVIHFLASYQVDASITNLFDIAS